MSILELPSREHAERLLASTDLNLSGWMDRIGLEIYPTFFVGEPVDVAGVPPTHPAGGPPHRVTPRSPLARAGRRRGSGRIQSSSRMVALAWPPPSHMVCRP